MLLILIANPPTSFGVCEADKIATSGADPGIHVRTAHVRAGPCCPCLPVPARACPSRALSVNAARPACLQKLSSSNAMSYKQHVARTHVCKTDRVLRRVADERFTPCVPQRFLAQGLLHDLSRFAPWIEHPPPLEHPRPMSLRRHAVKERRRRSLSVWP